MQKPLTSTPGYKKATRQQTKEHNRLLVLKTIYQQARISRADIARLTKLTRTTVSDIVGGLIDEGMVVEVGQSSLSVGKPATHISLVSNARHMVCVDLSDPDYCGAVMNLSGEVVYRETISPQIKTGEAALEDVFLLIDHLIGNINAPLLGISIGVGGMVDVNTGMIKRAVNRGWRDVPLKDILVERYCTPVYVTNDCHIAALAEYTYGHWRNTPNLAVVKVGEGVGAGFILSGKLFLGDGFSAGGIGHLIAKQDGDLCACGNYGCLETVASTASILASANAIAAEKPQSALGVRLSKHGSLDINDISELLHSGDADVNRLVSSAACYLGVAIANFVGLLNMRRIVIFGEAMNFGDEYLRVILEEARSKVIPIVMAETEIAYSTLGSNIILAGLSALLLSRELRLP